MPSMGEEKREVFGSMSSQYVTEAKEKDNWVIMENKDKYDVNKSASSTTSTSSIGEESTNYDGSTSSMDTMDDATSSSTSCSSLSSCEPLYDLSDIMAQLPIKRGLSMYYQGESQSFSSLSRVRSIEDLAKKETRNRRKIKGCKSYRDGLESHRSYTLPKPIISKKARGALGLIGLADRRVSSCGMHAFINGASCIHNVEGVDMEEMMIWFDSKGHHKDQPSSCSFGEILAGAFMYQFH